MSDSEESKCPICGGKMMFVRLFNREWWECNVSVLIGIFPNPSTLFPDLAEQISKHEKETP